MKYGRSYYIINGITMYRLVSAPFLLLLALAGEFTWFKYLITLSFFTDAIDGPLARRYKATSVFGSRLDSVADDAVVLVAIIAVWLANPAFILEHWLVIAGLLALFAIQTVAALVAYQKVTSFHTYLAKMAAVTRAVFFILFFLQIGPVRTAFFLAMIVTAMQLIEEIILVLVLPYWTSNVKGLYWVLRSRRHAFTQITD